MRTPPKHVFLDTSIECNLRCIQCDIWTLKNPPDSLTLAERTKVLEEVGLWSAPPRVVLTGGELLMRPERLYETAEAAKRLGIYVTISSNGTLVRPGDLARLPHSGISCIVFSVDSHKESVHDEIRGVPGTFRRVINSLREMTIAKAGTGLSVITSTILGEHNLDDIDALVDFLEAEGAETTVFQPIQPVFARSLAADWHFGRLFPRDIAKVDRGIDNLIRLKRAGRRLFQSEQQFEDMRAYFRNPLRVKMGQCASADNSIMIDIVGQARLCFNMERIGLSPIGNVRNSSLQELWDGTAANEARKIMSKCTEGCASMVCHAR
jgi:MoaA/NifB/PqqE/SkfB family radical SAM enzyme